MTDTTDWEDGVPGEAAENDAVIELTQVEQEGKPDVMEDIIELTDIAGSPDEKSIEEPADEEGIIELTEVEKEGDENALNEVVELTHVIEPDPIEDIEKTGLKAGTDIELEPEVSEFSIDLEDETDVEAELPRGHGEIAPDTEIKLELETDDGEEGSEINLELETADDETGSELNLEFDNDSDGIFGDDADAELKLELESDDDFSNDDDLSDLDFQDDEQTEDPDEGNSFDFDDPDEDGFLFGEDEQEVELVLEDSKGTDDPDDPSPALVFDTGEAAPVLETEDSFEKMLGVEIEDTGEINETIEAGGETGAAAAGTDVSESLFITALEKVIEKKFAEKIESILFEVMERVIERELASIQESLKKDLDQIENS